MAEPLDRERSIEHLLRQSLRATPPASSSCVDAEQMAAWTAGGLRGEEAAAVERHLADCAGCQAMLAAFVDSEPVATTAVVPFWRSWTMRWLVPATAAGVAVIVWTAVTSDNREVPVPTTMARVEPAPAGPMLPEAGVIPAPAPAEPPPASVSPAPLAPPVSARDRENEAQAGAMAAQAVPSPATTVPPPGALAESPLPDAAAARQRAEAAEAAQPSAAARAAEARTTFAPPPAPPAPGAPQTPSPAEAPAAAAGAPLPAPAPAAPAQAGAPPPSAPAPAASSPSPSPPPPPPPPPPTATDMAAVPQPAGAAMGLAVRPAVPVHARAGAAASVQFSAPPPARSEARFSDSTVATPPAAPLRPFIRWRISPAGRLDRSLDGAQTWTPVDLPPTVVVRAGSAPIDGVCWIVGLDGAVLRSIDGYTFERRPFPDAVAFAAVEAQDASRATVTTADGRAFATTDAGVTWQALP